MEAKEFIRVRHELGKTQAQMARLLCVSPKAIQSFEQEWRNIPASAERQVMFLSYLKRASNNTVKQCWEINACPDEWRKGCPAWELRKGQYCWFINGTFCRGQSQDNWEQKTETCRQCEVFRSMFPSSV